MSNKLPKIVKHVKPDSKVKVGNLFPDKAPEDNGADLLGDSSEDASEELNMEEADAQELVPEPPFNKWADRAVSAAVKKGDLLGYHPVTGEKVHHN